MGLDQRTSTSAFLICAMLLSAAALAADRSDASTQSTTAPSPDLRDPRFRPGKLLYSEDFSRSTPRWSTELENGGNVMFADGRLDVDVPAGATVWFKPLLSGPILIQYNAVAISANGANDRVSDLNCFWMARDSRNPNDIFAVLRHGKFAEYNPLLTYYVGLGGNGNTTTRFRRYVGDQNDRSLLPRNDLRGKDNLLLANDNQLIQLIACGNLVQFYRDGRKFFEMNDAQPYTSGWFAFRTTKSHVQFRSFKVFALIPNPP
jgi:hypothetical protein